MIKTSILVGLGGFAGTLLRFLVGTLFKSGIFPVTFFINIVGSFIIGMIMGSVWRSDVWKAALGIGFCGGFTTFSAFSIENVLLFERGKPLIAAAYILSSVAGGIFSAYLGYKFTHK